MIIIASQAVTLIQTSLAMIQSQITQLTSMSACIQEISIRIATRADIFFLTGFAFRVKTRTRLTFSLIQIGLVILTFRTILGQRTNLTMIKDILTFITLLLVRIIIIFFTFLTTLKTNTLLTSVHQMLTFFTSIVHIQSICLGTFCAFFRAMTF